MANFIATKQPGLGSAPNGGDCKGIRTKIAFYSALGTRYINYRWNWDFLNYTLLN